MTILTNLYAELPSSCGGISAFVHLPRSNGVARVFPHLHRTSIVEPVMGIGIHSKDLKLGNLFLFMGVDLKPPGYMAVTAIENFNPIYGVSLSSRVILRYVSENL